MNEPTGSTIDRPDEEWKKVHGSVLMPPSSARFSLTRIGDLPGSTALLKKETRFR